MTSTNTPKQSTIMPLLLSVLVHGAIFGALLLYKPAPKPPIPTGIEASFIGQAELSEIEGAIRENAKAQQMQAQESTSNLSTEPTLPTEIQRYNEQVAKREQAFQERLAKFRADQNAAIQAQMDAFDAELKAEYEQEQAELARSQEAFKNRDKIIAEQAKKAKEESNKQAKENKETNANQTKKDKAPPSDGTGNQSEQSPSGTNASKTTSVQSGAGKDSLQQAITRHIKAYWHPIGETGTRLNTQIRVDADGNVLSVKVTGGTDAQRQSLEDAIYASSPITPIVGTEFRTFSPYFVVQ